jgi:hypothetical protein
MGTVMSRLSPAHEALRTALDGEPLQPGTSTRAHAREQEEADEPDSRTTMSIIVASHPSARSMPAADR